MHGELLDEGLLIMEAISVVGNRSHFGWFAWSPSTGWHLLLDDTDPAFGYFHGVDANSIVFSNPKQASAANQEVLRVADLNALLTRTGIR